MKLNPLDLLDYLKSKDINFLYHANTVATAATFIEQQGLLSRGAVEDFGLYQTPQSSDAIDQKYNVWYDIFLDSVDLHKRFNRQNHYGPVLFKFDVDLLSSSSLPELWVTKDNPIRWHDGQTDVDRYFQNFDEFKETYTKGAYREMITLRFTKDAFPFEPYLKEIILDDPSVRISDLVIGSEARKILTSAIKNCPFIIDNVTRTLRKCDNCFCHDNYLNQVGVSRLKESFLIEK
ncbi:hypothetical protein [Bacillus sp. 37MA]|uniref:hypothetical protein n=1 Tax=Bacillus sp. 37MA TaxID=1132442 RepID=UPI0003827870|nr:hypothetical protein [Bacillus sp. 37MA]